MIFIGDIAIADEAVIGTIDLPDAFSVSPVIGNLEGAIANKEMASVQGEKVFNSDKVLNYLKQWHIKGVTLANNHITDVPEAFERTKKLLEENKIKYCGAGNTEKEAAKPMYFEEDGREVCVIAFGWDVIGCKKIRKNSLGVRLLDSDHILGQVAEIRKVDRKLKIYVVLHWDYELEKYPMPAHRILARKIIDAGADAVIGHHPHCIQSYEIYHGRPIFYSVGNWMFPHSVFANGTLSFPPYSYKELAVDVRDMCSKIYKFEFTPIDNSIKYIGVDTINHKDEGYAGEEYLKLYGNDYAEWFKRNRVKKKILPVYKRDDRCFENLIKNSWVKVRQILVSYFKKYFKRSKA